MNFRVDVIFICCFHLIKFNIFMYMHTYIYACEPMCQSVSLSVCFIWLRFALLSVVCLTRTARLYINTYKYMDVCICICVCVSACISVCRLYTYVCICLCIFFESTANLGKKIKTLLLHEYNGYM